MSRFRQLFAQDAEKPRVTGVTRVTRVESACSPVAYDSHSLSHVEKSEVCHVWRPEPVTPATPEKKAGVTEAAEGASNNIKHVGNASHVSPPSHPKSEAAVSGADVATQDVKRLLAAMGRENDARLDWWAQPVEGWPDSITLTSIDGRVTVIRLGT